MLTPLDELDASQVLLAAQEMTERQRAIDVEDLQLLARWAELHAADPMGAPGARRRWDNGGDRLVLVGGEGTPKVQELSLCELATARQVHLLRLRAMLADVLDLQHRLPLTWVVVKALGCDVWVARKVASLSRKLSEDVVHIVDAAVADAIAGESPGRVLELAEAKVIEADLAGHPARGGDRAAPTVRRAVEDQRARAAPRDRPHRGRRRGLDRRDRRPRRRHPRLPSRATSRSPCRPGRREPRRAPGSGLRLVGPARGARGAPTAPSRRRPRRRPRSRAGPRRWSTSICTRPLLREPWAEWPGSRAWVRCSTSR